MLDDRAWQAIALLLERGFKWREPFAGAHDRAYRVLLDGYSEQQLAAGIRRLVASGQVYGPAPGEIVQAIEGDPDRPTFLEAYSAIYDSRPTCGGRGVLWIHARGGGSELEARLDRAYEIHPLIGAFVHAYGVSNLQMLPVEHEEKGAMNRHQLEQAWDRFVEANAHRDAAALAAGCRRDLARGPQKSDFAGALGAGQSQPDGGEQCQQQQRVTASASTRRSRT